MPPTAWIFGQFAVANIGQSFVLHYSPSLILKPILASAVLPPSNPTNLVLAEAFGITFIKYPAWTILPTIAAAVAVYFLIAFVLFTSGKQIPKVIDTAALDEVPRLAEAEEEGLPANRMNEVDIVHHNPYAVNDKNGAIIGSLLFAVTLIILVGTSPINPPVYAITLPPAVMMLIRDAIHDRSTWRYKPVKETSTTGSITDEETINAPATNVDERWSFQKGWNSYKRRFPTVSLVLGRLPIACVLFALCMFIFVQGLTSRGWVVVFANWWAAWIRACSRAGTGAAIVGAIGMMFLLSIVLCNVSSRIPIFTKFRRFSFASNRSAERTLEQPFFSRACSRPGSWRTRPSRTGSALVPSTHWRSARTSAQSRSHSQRR